MRHPGAGRPLYGIDAGGSHTSVRAWNGDSWNAPPLNPSSVGQEESDRRLSEFLGQYTTNWSWLMAASTVATLPMVALFFLTQKTFIQGIALTGTKG